LTYQFPVFAIEMRNTKPIHIGYSVRNQADRF